MSDVEHHVEVVWDHLSEPRMAPYVDKVGGDRRNALAVYEWSTRTAAAAFEDVGHLEVLLRNALDRCLRDHFTETARGIPWFLMPVPGGDLIPETIEPVRVRLCAQSKRTPASRETRDQIVAGLTFGFWAGLLGTKSLACPTSPTPVSSMSTAGPPSSSPSSWPPTDATSVPAPALGR